MDPTRNPRRMSGRPGFLLWNSPVLKENSGTKRRNCYEHKPLPCPKNSATEKIGAQWKPTEGDSGSGKQRRDEEDRGGLESSGRDGERMILPHRAAAEFIVLWPRRVIVSLILPQNVLILGSLFPEARGFDQSFSDACKATGTCPHPAGKHKGFLSLSD